MQRNSRELLSLTAKLYFLDGLDQSQIAEIVGVSRSSVSRLLLRAREEGIVHVSVNGYSPRNGNLEAQLIDRFGLNHAVVVKTLAGISAAHVRRTIGYVAAPLVTELISAHSLLGISGGYSLLELVRHIKPINRHDGLTTVQLMGNIGPSVSETDPIELNRQLAHAFGGRFYVVNAPAFSPTSQARDAFLAHEHVRTVRELFSQVQVALVGIGSLENSVFVARDVLKPADLQTLGAHGAVGEICGRFFDQAGIECDTVYRERVIAVELDTLRQIPDVIGVANGTDRAEAIYTALKHKLLKSLIIDEAGALALVARARQRAS